MAKVLELQLQQQSFQWIFRTDFLQDELCALLAVQGTLRSLLQQLISKASVLQLSAFFMVQLSHPYMTTGKTIALTIWTFVSKVMSLLFNMLSGFVIAFLARSKSFLLSWLQSLYNVQHSKNFPHIFISNSLSPLRPPNLTSFPEFVCFLWKYDWPAILC